MTRCCDIWVEAMYATKMFGETPNSRVEVEAAKVTPRSSGHPAIRPSRVRHF